MMKKTLALLIALCMILCISACGENKKTKDEKEYGVSKEQIEDDISNLTTVKNGILKNTVAGEYVINDVTVDKRQTNLDDKNDIIYCIVNISNEYYESSVYIKLIYNLYNGDVWTLDDDEYISDKSTSKPLKCVEMSEFPQKFESFDVGIHEIGKNDIKHINDDSLTMCNVEGYTYKQTSHYKVTSKDEMFSADISVDYFFSPLNGWTKITNDYFEDNYKIEKMYILKPEKIFGNFKRVSQTIGRCQEYLSFYDYNSADNSISYTYTNEKNQKTNGTGVFDILNMSISSSEYNFSYETEYNVWRFDNGHWAWSYDMAYEKIS
ncbi:MAG: hypothetical protein IJE02_06130 [Clostridia bacterium]|nr:hypothetical protein [Clostridia bacterium]